MNCPPAPEKPRLAVQVGVTGHRPNRLQGVDVETLARHLNQVLADIDEAYTAFAATRPACFADTTRLPPRLLSPLAEGADSLAAQAALDLGYALHCPLPFPRNSYAADFTEAAALQTYQTLLAQAETVLELDGNPKHKDPAYRYMGHFILRHADVLIAVWNGERDDMSPGTSGIVALALHEEVPIILIRPDKLDTEAALALYDPRNDKEVWSPYSFTKLDDMLRWRLLPPAAPVAKKRRQLLKALQRGLKIPTDCCEAYFQHRPVHRNPLGTVYRTLFAWFGKHKLLAMMGNRYQEDAQQQWQTLVTAAAARQPKLVMGAVIESHFRHADSLASYYADQYRGTFVLSFF